MRGSSLAVLAVCLTLSPAAAHGGDAPLSAGSYVYGKLKVGDAVPELRGADVFGSQVSLEQMLKSGRKPILAFWSMYCQACIQKFKAMVAVQAKFADRGIAVVSVNTDGEYQKNGQAIREFIAEYEAKHGFKVNFPVLYDEHNWLAQAMGIEFLPTIVTVDGQGRVAGYYQKFGEAGDAAILAGIEELARDLLALSQSPAPLATPAGAK